VKQFSSGSPPSVRDSEPAQPLEATEQLALSLANGRDDGLLMGRDDRIGCVLLRDSRRKRKWYAVAEQMTSFPAQ
jgi:hypothetical protein